MYAEPGTSRLSTRHLDAPFAPVVASLDRDVSHGYPAQADGRAEVADTEPRGSRLGSHKMLVTVSIAAMLTAACSSGKAAQPTPTPSPSPSVTVEAQVLAAWRAEHVAYADALRSVNPELPALAQTAIDPVLRSIKAYIAVAKAQGIVVHGSQNLGSPKVVSLTPATTPTEAVVESCVHGGLILTNGKTGKPVPGLAGKVTWNFEHTTLTLVEGVGWMVSNNVVKQDLKESVCAGS